MAISKMLASMAQYITEGVMRIFTPTDDAYPNTGVQPYTGSPYKKRTAGAW